MSVIPVVWQQADGKGPQEWVSERTLWDIQLAEEFFTRSTAAQLV
jgi:hypothetical protein